jgi:hypothetical protein
LSRFKKRGNYGGEILLFKKDHQTGINLEDLNGSLAGDVALDLSYQDKPY